MSERDRQAEYREALSAAIFRTVPTTKRTFSISPYDASLDLTNKGDCTLFKNACVPLSKDPRSDGSKKGWQHFVKHLATESDLIKYKEAFKISTAWHVNTTAGGLVKNAIGVGIIDILKMSTTSTASIEKHCDLAWNNDKIGDTALTEIFYKAGGGRLPTEDVYTGKRK